MVVASDFPVVEVVKGRLYFTCFTKVPLPQPGIRFVCTDRTLLYWNFFLDFGPMNLGQTYRFCELVQGVLDDFPQDKVVYYCAGNHGQRRANSVMLICAYQMLVLGRSALDAFRPFQHQFVLPAFHDATPCHCPYELTVLDCLMGMDKAIRLGFCNFNTFDPDEYEHFEKVESGDLSWIFPGKFVAFAGPHEERSHDAMYPKCVPEDYLEHFTQKNVGLVIRLNKKYYDESRFTRRGVSHEELYYPDGSNPPLEVLERFLAICESRPAHEAIAVHCKAGLGRTGTCIGAYAMKHYGFTSKEVIGWMRICRPGSVIGPQQQYLDAMQDYLFKSSNHKQQRPSRGVTVTPSKASPVLLLQSDEEVDKSQGDFLISAKAHHALSSPAAAAAAASPDDAKKRIAFASAGAAAAGEEHEPACAENDTVSGGGGGALYAFRLSVSRKLFGK